MTTLRQAAQQALEALENHATQYPHMQKGYTVDAITALRDALAQQEPAWKCACGANLYIDADGKPRSRAALAQEEQEPVAWAYEIATTVRDGKGARWESRITEYEPKVPISMIRNLTPLYTASPRREWQGLTEEELLSLLHSCDWRRMHLAVLCRAVEAKLKEKNHG